MCIQDQVIETNNLLATRETCCGHPGFIIDENCKITLCTTPCMTYTPVSRQTRITLFLIKLLLRAVREGITEDDLEEAFSALSPDCKRLFSVVDATKDGPKSEESNHEE